MGAVGISFGSPISGVGFNVSQTVSQIVGNLQNVETPWKNQVSTTNAQDTVISNLGSLLSQVSTDMSNLTNFQGVLAGKQGSSSDPSVIALTSASSSAVAGTHTIVVNSLASTSSGYLAAITNSSDTLSGSLTIQVGSGTAQTITIGSTSNTLTTLATAINSAAIGVNASVITDANGSRLSLVSGTSGAGGNLTVTSSVTDSTTSTALGYTSATTGANASLVVDGVSVAAASNTVSTVIPGVTFQLLAPSPITSGTPETVQVQILNDNTAVVSSVGQLVSDYNAVISAVNAQEANSTTGTPQPLFGSPTLAMFQEQLLSTINQTNTQGNIGSATQLGISVNNDGTLSLDTSTLNTELNQDYSGVVSFFQNAGSWGLNFSTAVNTLGTSSPTGMLSLDLSANSAIISSLNQNISNENLLISSQQSSLTTELNLANQTLQQIPSNLNNMSEIYSAVTGYVNPTL